MNRIRLTMLIACLAQIIIGQAQVAYWKLKPSYQEITPFSESLYKAKTYEDMRLINANGDILVKADSITYLTNGYALVLKYQDEKYRVIQIVDGNGKTTDITQEYYATEYPFFSEEKCPVENKKGKIGYINPSGKQVISFDYVVAHPFREGYASVCKAKKGFIAFGSSLLGKVAGNSKTPSGPSQYIDHKGAPLKLQSEIGTPILATSFKNGEALVQCDDNNSFMINRQGKIVKTLSDVEVNLDDYFAISEKRRERANVPYLPSYNPIYTVFATNNLFGYKHGATIISPAQFELASGFASGFSIVKMNGKYGLLQLIPGKIDMTVNDKGGKLTVEGTIPAELNNCQASFVRTVNKTEKLSFPMEGMQSARSLEVEVTEPGGSRTYDIVVNDLAVWHMSAIGYGMDNSKGGRSKHEGRGSITVKAPASVKANGKGMCIFDVTVRNRSESSQMITVTLSTGDSKTINLAAGKTGTVSFSVSVSKETSCKIRANSSGGSSSYTTKLLPAFKL